MTSHCVIPKLSTQYNHLAVFEAYFDESGDPADPKVEVFTLAWLVAPAEDWKKFTETWNRLLRRHKVSMMHMTDFEHSIGDLKGWDKTKKDSFAAQLAGVLKTTFKLGTSHSMSVEIWNKVIAPSMETPYKKKRGPYIFLLQSCLEQLVEYGKDLPSGERIACIFDENKLVSDAAKGHYTLLKEVRGWNNILEGSVFESKRNFIPLQAADILAYEGYKDLVNIIAGQPRPRRKLLVNLMRSNRIKHSVLDLEGLWKDVQRTQTSIGR